MTGVEIAAGVVWGCVLIVAPLVLAPAPTLHRRIVLWFRGDDHDAGRRAELAWWNDAREHAKRQALKAANDVTPSVAAQAQVYGDSKFVIHAECVGRPMTILIAGVHEDVTIAPEGRYDAHAD